MCTLECVLNARRNEFNLCFQSDRRRAKIALTLIKCTLQEKQREINTQIKNENDDVGESDTVELH